MRMQLADVTPQLAPYSQVNVPNFKLVGGIAKPQDTTTLGLFQGLQRQVNAFLSRYAVGPRVSVDGDIGPATLNSTRLVLAYSAQQLGGQLGTFAAGVLPVINSVEALARAAAQVTQGLSSIGIVDTFAQPNVSHGITGSKSVAPAASGSKTAAAPPPSSGGGNAIWWVLAALAAGGAYLWWRNRDESFSGLADVG